MRKTVTTFAALAALLCAGTALAARDQRVLKAINFFDRAEFTKAKDLLVTLVESPSLSDEDLLQSRIYLAASYYGLGDRASAKAQFLVLVRRFPRAELDPGLFLPEVVDLFNQARMEVAEAAKDRGAQGKATPSGPGTAKSSAPLGPGGPAGGFNAMSLLPFGAGQFARGDATFGHLFLWSEVGTLALAAAAKVHFQYLKREPSGPWNFSGPAYVENVGYATMVQNIFGGALIASGVIAVAGIAEAVLRPGGAGPAPMKLSLQPAPGGLAVRF